MTGELPVLRERAHLVAVCLDLDGVLNPYGEEGNGEFVAHSIRLRVSDLPEDSPFLRNRTDEDLPQSVLVSNRHAKWLKNLVQKADVYWSTTWENAANVHYAPLLGIENLEVIPHSKWPATFSDIKHGDAGHWKHYALNDLFSERALVWVDDQARTEGIDYWRKGKPTLVIVPDGRVGLSQEDMGRIDKFVTEQTLA